VFPYSDTSHLVKQFELGQNRDIVSPGKQFPNHINCQFELLKSGLRCKRYRRSKSMFPFFSSKVSTIESKMMYVS
jgi:hypothetical protein